MLSKFSVNENTESSVKMDSIYFDIRDDQLPIIYSSVYDIHFMGLEKMHPFDSAKWGKIFRFLQDASIIKRNTSVEPKEATEEVLLVVHSQTYLNKLKWSAQVARITEVPCVAIIPNKIVQRHVLRPFRFQTGGSILAGKLALERGWAINLGGGFHHCSSTAGGGFCAYADITLCIQFLFNRYPSAVSKVMIVDLDAHQGNGHERDFKDDERVYILDVYNRAIYPGDTFAKKAIKRAVDLRFMTEDEEYLGKVNTHLDGALNEFPPDIIIYNAGTDILKQDPLGCLAITPKGIIERDEIVFTKARQRNIPIVMLTSGGYQKCTARIIADSIINLFAKNLLSSTNVT